MKTVRKSLKLRWCLGTQKLDDGGYSGGSLQEFEDAYGGFWQVGQEAHSSLCCSLFKILRASQPTLQCTDTSASVLAGVKFVTSRDHST